MKSDGHAPRAAGRGRWRRGGSVSDALRAEFGSSRMSRAAVGEEGLGDLDQLLLTESEPSGGCVQVDMKAQLVEDGLCPPAHLGTLDKTQGVNCALGEEIGQDVQVGVQAELLEDDGHPVVVGGLHALELDRRPADPQLAGIGSSAPAIVFMSVDLPAPFSPTMACTSPVDLEVHPGQGDDPAVALLHPGGDRRLPRVEQRRSPRRRRSSVPCGGGQSPSRSANDWTLLLMSSKRTSIIRAGSRPWSRRCRWPATPRVPSPRPRCRPSRPPAGRRYTHGARPSRPPGSRAWRAWRHSPA